MLGERIVFYAAYGLLLHFPSHHSMPLNPGSELPKMLPISDDKRILIATTGSSIAIRCPVDTKHHITFIEWSKGCVDLYNEDFVGYTVTDRGVLRIRNVTSANAGLYTCNATNGHGSISIRITLIVVDPGKTNSQKNMNQSSFQPELQDSEKWVPRIDKPQIREFKEESGGAIAIHCSAIGYPAPHIFWMKNGKLVEGPGLDSKRTRSRAQSSLTLPKLRKADSGVYKCIAKNNVGQDQMDFNLHVVDPQFPPEIQSLTPPNSTVASGHMVVFRCKGRSLPYLRLHIKWMKTIRQDQMQKSNRTFHLGSNYYKVLDTDEDPIMANNGRFQSELLIPNATIHDSGIYVCLAVNDRGYRYKNVSLRVVVPDRTISSLYIASPSPSFMVFVIFTSAVVMAPIVFLVVLLCHCKFSTKINLTQSPPEEKATESVDIYQKTNNERTQSLCCKKSKLVSTDAPKPYDWADSSCPLNK